MDPVRRMPDGSPCWCVSNDAPHEGWVHSPTCLRLRLPTITILSPARSREVERNGYRRVSLQGRGFPTPDAAITALSTLLARDGLLVDSVDDIWAVLESPGAICPYGAMALVPKSHSDSPVQQPPAAMPSAPEPDLRTLSTSPAGAEPGDEMQPRKVDLEDPKFKADMKEHGGLHSAHACKCPCYNVFMAEHPDELGEPGDQGAAARAVAHRDGPTGFGVEDPTQGDPSGTPEQQRDVDRQETRDEKEADKAGTIAQDPTDGTISRPETRRK